MPIPGGVTPSRMGHPSSSRPQRHAAGHISGGVIPHLAQFMARSMSDADADPDMRLQFEGFEDVINGCIEEPKPRNLRALASALFHTFPALVRGKLLLSTAANPKTVAALEGLVVEGSTAFTRFARSPELHELEVLEPGQQLAGAGAEAVGWQQAADVAPCSRLEEVNRCLSALIAGLKTDAEVRDEYVDAVVQVGGLGPIVAIVQCNGRMASAYIQMCCCLFTSEA